MFIEKIKSLKDKANALMKNQAYEAACAAYGELMQHMMACEGDNLDLNDDEMDEFNRLKAIIFSNIALGNLKLGSFEAVRRCCSAAVVFINEPQLALVDLGLEEREGGDVNENPTLVGPIRQEVRSLAAKVLYRRACAMHSLSELAQESSILNDLHVASSLAPADRAIQDLLRRVEDEKRRRKVSSGAPTPSFLTVRIQPEREGMLINGGYCYKRAGFWSQTVTAATVYLPLSLFLLTKSAKKEKDPKGMEEGLLVNVGLGESRAGLSVILGRDIVTIHVPGGGGKGEEGGVTCHQLPLEYFIDLSESSWTLESLYTQTDVLGPSNFPITEPLPPSHLVLHLFKTPSVEWFPGCEWWSSVFIGDEEIDVSTCTVGTDTSELPPEARARAHVEHARFEDQSYEKQQQELAGLADLKKVTQQALEKHNRELQAAYGEEPQRKEMIEALSSEFPNIYFGAK